MKRAKRILCILLVISVILTFLPGTVLAAQYIDEYYNSVEMNVPEATTHEENCCSECAAEYLFEGISIEEFQSIVQSDEQIYRDFRVRYDFDSPVVTYRVPVEAEEITYTLTMLEGGGIQPLSNPFPVTRIRYSERSHADSIVIMLLGDGFSEAEYGTWPSPAPGTALYHADRSINTMMDIHPFGLFEDLITVYVIHATGTNPETGWNGYLGTVTAAGTVDINQSADVRQQRIRELANSVVAPTNQTMIQVISNATNGQGFAWMGWHYELHLNIAVTSIFTSANGGSTAAFPNGSVWHGIFVHEFGHSFGVLVDEHGNGAAGEHFANSTQAAHEDLKWRHWFGHRLVPTTPVRVAGNWAVPAGSTCLMFGVIGSSRDFCGVCIAEFTRRMALISGETFIGRSPVTDSPLLNTPWVTIPQGATRILDSAFHGNTSLNTIIIPESVDIIGDFAFIGATGLNTIINHSVTPQQINNTTLAGVNRGNIYLHVPEGTAAAYLAAGWTGFRGIEGEVAVTGVSITGAATRSLVVGRQLNLVATVTPSYATNQNVIWSTSNTSVATVSGSGQVTAHAVGTAVITLVTEDGDFTATATINVTPVLFIDEFPDDNFRQAVFDMLWRMDGVVRTDASVISDSDMALLASIDHLSLWHMEIADMTGLKHFPQLVWLSAGGNNLSVLDVTSNPQLWGLSVSENNLSILDVSNNPQLSTLWVNDNDLTNLDVSNNLELSELEVANNQLTRLDTSNNPQLWELNVRENNLSVLDVSNNPQLSTLWACNNELTNLNVSNSPQLRRLWANDNELTNLNVSNNFELTNLHVSNNLLKELDLSNNPQLTALWADNNMLTTLDISNTALNWNWGWWGSGLHVSNNFMQHPETCVIGWQERGIVLNSRNFTFWPQRTVSVNRDALSEAIAETENRVRTNYTPASWLRLTAPLNQARSMYNNANATQVQINSATNNLRAAIEALVPVQGQQQPVVDRDALRVAIANAESRVQANYTPASWLRLTAPLNQARSMYNNANATQAQVNTATNNLITALSNLVVR